MTFEIRADFLRRNAVKEDLQSVLFRIGNYLAAVKFPALKTFFFCLSQLIDAFFKAVYFLIQIG